MNIVSVNKIGHYIFEFEPNAYEKIESDPELMEYMEENYGIDNVEDIYIDDFVHACKELGLDYFDYIDDKNILEVIFDNGDKRYISILDIEYKWQHVNGDCCGIFNGISFNWQNEYLMIIASGASGQCTFVVVYNYSPDKNEDWYWEAPFLDNMLYAPEINRFIGFYDISTWEHNGFGLYVINAENFCEDFYDCNIEYEDITFEAHGYVYDEEGNKELVDESRFIVDLGDEKPNFEEFIKCNIGKNIDMYWDGREKCIYIKYGKTLYKYSIL